jgi:hypothetical protein
MNPNVSPLPEHTYDTSTVPVLSIFNWVYNHGRYLRQSIDSILQQRTNFPVEIIVHDDASTDGGAEIIMEYEGRFPRLFRNVLHSVNQHSQGKCLIAPLLARPRGTFVALTHGDDYWTSPDKLQRQVDLLLANSNASGCFHAADDINEISGESTPGFWRPPGHRPGYGVDDLFKVGNFTTTASVIYRVSALPASFDRFHGVTHGDFLLLMHALKNGPMLYIDEVMSAYRRHPGGIHTSTYGVVSAMRALHALIEGAAALDLQQHPGYLDSVRWRLSEALEAHSQQRSELESLRAQLRHVSEKYDAFRQTTSVSLLMRADRMIKRLLSQLNFRRSSR